MHRTIAAFLLLFPFLAHQQLQDAKGCCRVSDWQRVRGRPPGDACKRRHQSAPEVTKMRLRAVGACLERVRFAIDPNKERFYFGTTE